LQGTPIRVFSTADVECAGFPTGAYITCADVGEITTTAFY